MILMSGSLQVKFTEILLKLGIVLYSEVFLCSHVDCVTSSTVRETSSLKAFKKGEETRLTPP